MEITKQWALVGLFKEGKFFADIDGNLFSKINDKVKQLQGTKHSGYIQYGFSCGFNNTIMVYGHVAVWIYFNGIYNPDFEIDHLDKNPSNNAIHNLRPLSKKAHYKTRKYASGKRSRKLILKRGFGHIPNTIKYKVYDDYLLNKPSFLSLSKKYLISRQSVSTIISEMDKVMEGNRNKSVKTLNP